MKDLKQRFVEEYCIVWKGAPAAIRAGYAKSRAKQTARDLLQDPEIQAAIKEYHSKHGMSVEEAIKRNTDIGRTRLNDYMKVEEVWESTFERKPLADLIAELNLQIKIDDEFSDRAGLTEQEQGKIFELNKAREREILRYEIELKLNPKAYRVVKSEPRPVEKPTVDLIKLAKADEEGAIKKISWNERGLPSVEMYPADAAIKTALQIHGKLVEKHDHSSSDGSMTPKSIAIDPAKLTPEQLSNLVDVIRNVEQS
ncbi:hypothetical protein GO755_26455 [Spirosoma sp. HMF4905]|uniref:Terminase small subunit n=1 Tax=Spirosoma arboris TaxID=2682092 RepID=A0A7K1SIQ6_9BACT|nr:terminase small subunit [Spirosoma arboris]MVM33608.1 hypothetical protein [Spirosoma arboris]